MVGKNFYTKRKEENKMMKKQNLAILALLSGSFLTGAILSIPSQGHTDTPQEEIIQTVESTQESLPEFIESTDNSTVIESTQESIEEVPIQEPIEEEEIIQETELSQETNDQTIESTEAQEEVEEEPQEKLPEAIEQAVQNDTDYQVLLDNENMVVEYIQYNSTEFQVVVTLKDGKEFVAYDSDVSDNQSYLTLMFE